MCIKINKKYADVFDFKGFLHITAMKHAMHLEQVIKGIYKLCPKWMELYDRAFVIMKK